MDKKNFYILLLMLLSVGGLKAQITCVQNFTVTLDENGNGDFLASELVPNVEFLLSTGTVTYFFEPYMSGILNSGSDIITIDCNTSSVGTYIIEHYVEGEEVDFCIANIIVEDPFNSCPNHPFCNDIVEDCKKTWGSYSVYNANSIAATVFPVCDNYLNCTGSYGIAIGTLADAENLTYSPVLDLTTVTDFESPIVISYTLGGVVSYDNSKLRIWGNLECRIFTTPSNTVELDLTAEATLIPSIFLDEENTCTDISIAITEINGDVPTDFFDNITVDCDDIGYHTVYLKDVATGFTSTSQLFVADPLETCGPILGVGDKLIKMSKNPPIGTYSGTTVTLNGTNLTVSPTGKGWIINEDMLIDGSNTLDFDSGPFNLNGVSTLDLVRLQRLIIFDEYDKPIQSVVMDMDDSGYNGIADILISRLVILGNPSPIELVNSIFIHDEFQFPNDFNPFDFDYDFTKYQFEKSDFDNLTFDFQAFKMGDFNDNAVTEDNLKQTEISSSRNLNSFEIPDMDVLAGIPFSFSLKYDSEVPIKGLLAAIVSNGVKFESLTSEYGGDVLYNVINDNEIRISYLVGSGSSMSDNISFEIVATSNTSGSLIDLLGLKAGFPQEVVDENDEIVVIEDIEEMVVSSLQKTNLDKDLSIYPNPVNQKLVISLAEGTLGKVDIIDPMGKKILSRTSDLDEIQIDVSALVKGIYYIRIENNDNLINKSFIKM